MTESITSAPAGNGNGEVLVLGVEPDLIPATLRQRDAWVLWGKGHAIEPTTGKPNKQPLKLSGYPASHSDSATWTTFDNALAEYRRQNYWGFGVCFNGDGCCGLDLDGCRDRNTGVISDTAQRIIDVLDTYCEVSPSGTGVKMWFFATAKTSLVQHAPSFKGQWPLPGLKGVEFYSTERFFATTGHRLPGSPAEPQQRDAEITELLTCWRAMFDLGKSSTARNGQTTSQVNGIDIREFLRRNNVEVIRDGHAGGRECIYVKCPRIECHTNKNADTDCKVFTSEPGGAFCHHQSCGICSWRDFREAIGCGGSTGDTRPQTSEKSDQVSPSPRGVEKKTTLVVPPWRPFPTECLPSVLAEFISESGSAIDCDDSFVALPVLGVTAGAIGGTRRLVVKRGWSEPATSWTCIVSPSGTAKSVAWRAAVSPIFRHHRQQIEAYQDSLAKHDARVMIYECDTLAWKAKRKKGDVGEPPAKPEPPPEIRFMVDDPTLQKLVPLLGQNPRGLVLLPSSGEAGSWLGDFNRWSGAGGVSSDALRWTATFHGDSITSDRVTGGVRYVPHAYVSVAGNIQPETLKSALGQEHLHNGLAARLLLAMPPRSPKRITDIEVSEATEHSYVRLIDSLLNLQLVNDDSMKPQPVYVGLRSNAKHELVAFLNDHNEQLSELDDAHERASWSKLEAYSIRLSLLIHMVRVVTGEVPESDPVDIDSVRSAIRLTEWFRYESQRVYAWLSGAIISDSNDRLIEWIRSKGGSVTVRNLQQTGPRQFRASAEKAEVALQSLVTARVGQWTTCAPGPQGGWPVREFHLPPLATATLAPETREIRASVASTAPVHSEIESAEEREVVEI